MTAHHPYTRKHKKGRGESFSPHFLPLPSKRHPNSRDSFFYSPKSPFLCVLFHFLVLILTPTSKYLILWLPSFPLVYFDASFAHACSKPRGILSLDCCLFLLSWRVVGNGLRPKLCSEKGGHAALPPFPCYSCLNMRPPSAR